MTIRLVTTIALVATMACTANAQQPGSAPFLTGNCASRDSTAVPSDYVENPERAASIRRDIPIPPFPDTVHRAGYEGKVVAAFIVDRDGRVRDGRVAVLSSTDAVLSRWACASIPKMRLEPARDHGKKVASQVILPFAYSVPADSSRSAKPQSYER